MFKKYDPRSVRSYRSYKLSDLCRLYKDKKLHAQTIRSWINSGKLEAFSDGKNILVYGAIFKQFLLDSNNSHKRTLGFSQFRCGKCKAINAPLDNCIIKLTEGKNNCIVAFGVCTSCGHKIQRIYRGDLQQKILETFNIQHNELEALYNHSCTPSNTHQEIEVKTTLSESLETPVIEEPTNTTKTPSNTHIEPDKNTTANSKTNLYTFQPSFL